MIVADFDGASVSDRFYTDLVDFAASSGALSAGDAALTAEVASLLHFEARLLDERRYVEWLDLLTESCSYWIPINPEGGDPRMEWSLSLDDRRRIEDRVRWLGTGDVHGQRPSSRTRRLLTNIEGWSVSADQRRARSNFVLFEHRLGRTQRFVGAYEHCLRRGPHGWRIDSKRVMLIDSDAAQANVTFVF